MITVYDLHFPEFLHSFHDILLILELVLILPGVIVVLYTAYVILLRVPQFHPHIHMLISTSFCAYFIITFTRLAIILLYFTENSQFEISHSQSVTVLLDGIRTAVASAVIMTAPVLTFERTLATIRITTYENERHPFLVSLVILLSWIACGFCVYLVIFVGIDVVIFISFGIFCLFLNLFVFYQLVSWSQKQYEKQIVLQKPLTIRFQLSENVRIGKIFLVVVRAFCVCASIALILAVIVTKRWSSALTVEMNHMPHATCRHGRVITIDSMVSIPYDLPITTLLLYHIYELFIAIATALIGLTMILSDQRWRKEFRRILLLSFKCGRKRVEQKKPTSVFSLAGDQLVFEQKAEANTYFVNLQNKWQIRTK